MPKQLLGMGIGIVRGDGGCSEDILVQDGFSGASVDINGSSPDTVDPGDVWANTMPIIRNSWKRNGQADCQSNSWTVGCKIDAGESDVTIEASCHYDLSQRLGLIFRHQDQNNMWVVYYDGSLHLLKIVSGGEQYQGVIGNPGIGNQVTFDLKVEMLGSILTFYVNDAQLGASIDDNYLETETEHGIYYRNDLDHWIDDFIVTRLCL